MVFLSKYYLFIILVAFWVLQEFLVLKIKNRAKLLGISDFEKIENKLRKQPKQPIRDIIEDKILMNLFKVYNLSLYIFWTTLGVILISKTVKMWA